ncbi:MAG: beta-lactamase family protein [Pseudomonadota bacterium]|nr:beta-lactamase family protein [Pseudomonadota bacterium]
MKHRMLYASVGMALAGALANPAIARSSHSCSVPRQTAVTLGPAQRARIDHLLADMVAKKIAPGAVVLIEQDGRIVYQRTLGMADAEAAKPMRADSLFRIFSMTKPVTSVAALQLVARGKLSLDAPLSHYIPEFAGTRVWTGSAVTPFETQPLNRPLTVRDLLVHGAGIVYAEAQPDPVHAAYTAQAIPAAPGVAPPPRGGVTAVASTAELARRIATAPLLHQPGARFTYGNSSDVLGRVVEVASGQRFADYVKRNILDPLAMSSTRFQPTTADAARMTSAYASQAQAKLPGDNLLGGVDPTTLKAITPLRVDEGTKSVFLTGGKIDFGGSGLVSTAADYGRFTQMLRQDGQLGKVRILPRALAREMRVNQLTPEARNVSTALTSAGLGFGYGLAVRESATGVSPIFPRCGAFWGGAASTFFWIDPAGRTSGVMMTQMFGGDVRNYWLEIMRTIYAPTPAPKTGTATR